MKSKKNSDAKRAGVAVDQPVSCDCSLRIRLVGDGRSICNPELDQELEADNIETEAADMAYDCGLGVSEWESMLTKEQGTWLAELAKKGHGTWGREGRIPASFSSARVSDHRCSPGASETNAKD
jgi:hypothetical protein